MYTSTCPDERPSPPSLSLEKIPNGRPVQISFHRNLHSPSSRFLMKEPSGSAETIRPFVSFWRTLPFPFIPAPLKFPWLRRWKFILLQALKFSYRTSMGAHLCLLRLDVFPIGLPHSSGQRFILTRDELSATHLDPAKLSPICASFVSPFPPLIYSRLDCAALSVLASCACVRL